MATREEVAFRRVLRDIERQMTAMFDELAGQVGQVILRYAGEDGKVPVERLQDVQREANRLVDAMMLGPGGRGFDEQNQPLSRYAQVIQDGQVRMLNLALERLGATMARYIPEDLLRELGRRWTTSRGAGAAPRSS